MQRRFLKIATNYQSGQALQYNSGQAAVISMIFFILISLVVLGSYVSIGIVQIQGADQFIGSKKALLSAQAGIEETVRRFEMDPLNVPSTIVAPTVNGIASAVSYQQDLDNNPDTYDWAATSTAPTTPGGTRTIKFWGRIPESSQHTSVGGALQIGYAGLNLVSGAKILSNGGAGSGNIVSNGTIYSTNTGSTPKIDGNVTVALPAGLTADQVSDNPDYPGNSVYPMPSACTATTPSPAGDNVDVNGNGCVAIGGPNTKPMDVAQSFIPSFTGKVAKIDLYIRKVGNPGALDVYIRSNTRVNKQTSPATVCNTAAEAAGYCIDAPVWTSTNNYTPAKKLNIGGSIGTTFGWVTVNLDVDTDDRVAVLASNKKYWIILDAANSDASNYYLVATRQGSYYTYGINDTYFSGERDFCYKYGLGGCPFDFPNFLIRDTDYSQATIYRKTADFGMTQTVDWYGFTPDFTQDMAFRVYGGESSTIIDASGTGGQLKITGNVVAPDIRGVDIEGTAKYSTLNYVTGLMKDEVIAGGDTALAPHTLAPPDSQACRYPTQGQTVETPPPFTNYCKCLNETGQACFNNSSIPVATPLFTYHNGPIPYGFIKTKKELIMDNGVATSTSIVRGQGNTTGSATTTLEAYPGSSGLIRVTGDVSISRNRVLQIPYPYTVWIQGNLELSDGIAGCELKPVRNPTGYQGKINYTITIIVDGYIKMDGTNVCKITPFNNPASYFRIITLSKRPLQATTFSPYNAAQIGGNVDGSIFYATRGRLTVGNTAQFRSIAANMLYVENGAQIKYEEGTLPDPLSENGGPQALGSEVFDYHEIE